MQTTKYSLEYLFSKPSIIGDFKVIKITKVQNYNLKNIFLIISKFNTLSEINCCFFNHMGWNDVEAEIDFLLIPLNERFR